MRQHKACWSLTCTYQGQSWGAPFHTLMLNLALVNVYWACSCLYPCVYTAAFQAQGQPLVLTSAHTSGHRVRTIYLQAPRVICYSVVVMRTSSLCEAVYSPRWILSSCLIIFTKPPPACPGQTMTNYQWWEGTIKASRGVKSKGSLYDMKRKSCSH